MNNQKATSGFTLIEMLVVVAIIVMLASLMIPSLQRIIERSKLVKCSNNLKSMYEALVLYGIDNEGRLPNPSGQGSSRRIASYINPYLDQGYKSNSDNGWFVPEEFRCPLEKEYYSRRQHCVGFNHSLANNKITSSISNLVLLGDTRSSFYIWLSRGDLFLHFRHNDPTRKNIGEASVIYGDGHWGTLKKDSPLITSPIKKCKLFVL